MTTVSELVKDPAWLPDGFDAARGLLTFARIDRAGLVREAFLDQRMAGSVTARAEAPLAAVAAAVAERAAPAFIFHTAFCCSTLLARALDAPGSALALKEPNVLMDLANATRVDERLRRDPAAFQHTAHTIFTLLARPHDVTERVVVKATNTAATLAPVALKLGAPCLFLYGDLSDFLVSLLKKGEEARSFVRGQFNIYALDGTGLGGVPQRQAMSFTDLQIASLVWRHQLEQFQRYLGAAPKGLAAALDFRALLADPAGMLKAVARHLRLPVPDATLDAAAAGPIFAANSKFADRKFDAAERDREDAAVAERWRDELALMLRWSKTLDLGVDLRLPLAPTLG